MKKCFTILSFFIITCPILYVDSDDVFALIKPSLIISKLIVDICSKSTIIISCICSIRYLSLIVIIFELILNLVILIVSFKISINRHLLYIKNILSKQILPIYIGRIFRYIFFSIR